jgi:hypothetical protein
MPDAVAMALKEWAAVCAALASGRQTILLRKGGIAEGPAGFQPEHGAFWLLPTHFHQRSEALSPQDRALFDQVAAGPADDRVRIDLFARVTEVFLLDREEQLDRFDDLHVYGRQTAHERFHYRRPGLWLLAVRIYRSPAIELPVWPELAGCHSWVTLPSALSTDQLVSVLDDETSAARLNVLRTVLS